MRNQYPVGTFNLVAIQDAIYNWVNDISKGVLADGGEIIWRQQSQPLPARPCVTLKILDGPTPVGRSGSVFLNGVNEPVSIGIQASMTLSIQVFGNTEIHAPMAYQLCVDINSSLMDPEVLSELKRGGVAIQGVGSPRNLSALEETEYEERAGIDIALGVSQNVVSKIGTIETINIHGTAGDIPVTTTVNLP